MQLLTKTKRPYVWFLRKTLLFYYYHVFLDIDKEIDEVQQHTVDTIIEILADDLRNLAKSYETHKYKIKYTSLSCSFNFYRLCNQIIDIQNIKEDYVVFVVEMILIKMFEHIIYQGKQDQKKLYNRIMKDILKIKPLLKNKS